MSETAETPEPEKKKSPMPMVAVALAGMAGVTVATMVIAPKVVAGRAAAAVEAAMNNHGAPADASAGDDGHGGGGNEAGGHAAGGAPSGDFVELGNLLVNPAGSQGLRFLMASVTFEVMGESGEAVDQLRAREAQLRDMVIGVLEQYTLERLSSPGARDSVKSQLAVAVDSVFHIPVGVFMPQFVIN